MSKRSYRNYTNTWRLNDTTFPDHGVIEETMREILKIVRNK
jgi:hypothetical protein